MDEVLSVLESRWSNINSLRLVSRSIVHQSSELKLFYANLRAIKEIAMTYEKWSLAEQTVTDDFVELSRQLEQCRVSEERII